MKSPSLLYLCFVLALLCGHPAFAQTQAVFTTDPKYLYHDSKTKEDSLRRLEHVKEMEWILHGHRFTWGEQTTLSFVPDANVMDTIFFHQSPRHDWDTLLCNVQYPGEYCFVYNECCGGFYLVNRAHKWVTDPTLDFSVQGKKGQLYAVQVHNEVAFLRSGDSLRMKDIPRGAMDPNVYGVKISEVKLPDSKLQASLKTPKVLSYESEEHTYEQVKVLCEFLYIDLDAEPMKVSWRDGKLVLGRWF